MSDVVSRRSVLVPTVTTIIVVAALLSLGVWQLERRVDKLALIAALEERLAAAPVALPPRAQWESLSPSKDEFRRVTLKGVFDMRDPAQVFTSSSPLRKDVSGTGTWLFAPVRLVDGDTVVVNRGFIADGQEFTPRYTDDPATLTGYIRFPEEPSWLTPHADRSKRLWFVRDHLAMAQLLSWAEPRRVAPFYIDLESPAPPGGIPKPGPLQVNLKNDHLQYAITWFLLAAAVSIAFAVWLRGALRRPTTSASL
jgi:cytochrome oxidase assembly protein ShyY1